MAILSRAIRSSEGFPMTPGGFAKLRIYFVSIPALGKILIVIPYKAGRLSKDWMAY